MDSLASGLTKAISDVLEQNEKRFVDQQSSQEAHTKLLENLQTRVDCLESKCKELIGENASLKKELEESKIRTELGAKEIKTSIIELEARLKKYGDWFNLITTIAAQVTALNDFRDNMQERMKEIYETQNEIVQQVRRHQLQLNAAAAAATNNTHSYRVPIKSPSTSSFLSSNNYTSLPRYKSNTNFNHQNNNLLSSLDPNDEMNDLSEHAENLRKGVQDLNALQRSFEKHSFYSDD